MTYCLRTFRVAINLREGGCFYDVVTTDLDNRLRQYGNHPLVDGVSKTGFHAVVTKASLFTYIDKDHQNKSELH